MRILHVIGWIDFADGGPPVIATRLAAAQANLGHEVTVAYYSSGATDKQTDEQLRTLPHWDKVKIRRFPQCSRLERMFGRDAGKRLEPLIAEVDALHLHNVWEGILLRSAAAARAMKKPYVILLNGMLEPWSLSQKSLKKKIALAMSHRRMLNGSSMLQFGTEHELELVKPLRLTAPTVVIPNGVMLEEIDPLPAKGEFLATRPELRGRRFVLFLARLHFKKGLDYLADAFAMIAAKHPDVDLVVAGPDGGQRENFQRQIAAAGLTPRVHVVGPLYGRQKFAALVDCDCFTLPSRQEGFSVAVLEAMAAGAPVVVTDACHFPSITTAGAGEVVEVSAAAVAGGLDRVLSNPDRARLGRAGRALIESNYTWNRVAEQTVAAYEQSIARTRNH